MDFTKIKTSRLFLRYVIPQMIGLLFNSVYFIVDGVFIGRVLGPAALAAAGVAVPVVEGSIALAMLISVGTGVAISAAMGRGDEQSARAAFNISNAFTLGFSLVVAVAGVLFSEQLAAALGADGAILADTATYLRWYLAFSPFLLFSFALSTYVRNDGAPRLAMVALVVGSLSNVLLDWVFMVPLGWGIGGAALATGLGPVFSVALVLPHFLRKKGTLYFEKVKFSLRVLGRILADGLPAFVSEFSLGFVTLLYNYAILKNGLGQDGLAVYMVIGYAALLCITAFLGAAQGIQPAISFFAGAGQSERIRSLVRTTGVFCVVLGGVLYLLLALFGRGFFGIFLVGEEHLLDLAQNAARLYFTCLPLAGLNILLVSAMQAMQKTGPSLVASLSRSTLPLMLLLQVLPLLLGQTGMWLAVTAAEGVTALLALVLWARLWAGAQASSSKWMREPVAPR